MPGTGRLETKRKTMRSAKVSRSFSRMSGWKTALMAACRSWGRCACLAAVATAQLHYSAAGGFDLLYRSQRGLVHVNCQGFGDVAAGKELDRAAEAAEDSLLFEQLRRHLRPGLEGREVAEVDGRVLDTEGVGEAAAGGEALDQAGLAAFEEAPRLVTGAGLLALEFARGKRTAAARVPAPHPPPSMRSPFGGLEIVG